jgi:hypothetical protein
MNIFKIIYCVGRWLMNKFIYSYLVVVNSCAILDYFCSGKMISGFFDKNDPD